MRKEKRHPNLIIPISATLSIYGIPTSLRKIGLYLFYDEVGIFYDKKPSNTIHIIPTTTMYRQCEYILPKMNTK